MSKFTTLGQRETYDNAARLLRANGYNVENARLTQSLIRSEVAMSASSTKFHFPIVINDSQNGNAFNTEKRLQLQDVFIVSAAKLCVAKPASASDGMFELFTYSNLTKFSAANTAASVRGAYSNGSLQLSIDNSQVMPYFPLNWMYKAPITQEAVDADYTTSNIDLLDSVDGSNDGIIQIEPNLILSGNAQIDVNLLLPTSLTAVETNSRFVLLFYGLLAQNCSKVAN